MNKLPNFIFIGVDDFLVRELCTTLLDRGFAVSVISPMTTKIIKLDGLTNRLVIPRYDNESFMNYLEDHEAIFDGLDGIFIWPSDLIMRLVAESKLSDPIKKKILPLKNALALKMFDSKIGQAEFLKNLGVAFPETEIVNEKSELFKLSESSLPRLLKSDRGGGGAFVTEFDNLESEDLKNLKDERFPAIVQEKILGHSVAVEAFFVDGELISWIYSISEAEQSKFGPSMSRTYLNPNNREFEDILSVIGKAAEVTGFVNVSFILDSQTGNSYIVEFDPRPNVWHFCFDYFDLPFEAAMSGKVPNPIHPILKEPIKLYEPYRLYSFSVAHLKLLNAVRVLLKRTVPGYGVPIPSSFYKPAKLIRRWILLIFFPLFKYREKALRFLRRMERRMRDLSSPSNSILRS